ncbi:MULTISPECIES: aminopeptidase 1 [unclassified Adlercreutzia]|uniref:aminopeptidase 1 n=1 Tax=unclassified Adlercreutzia TaxID=2636013 RepID=UPI0013EA11CC|nr:MULTISPECIES: aminopeptidase 1 [unclassified Adlercreutzia]
MEREVAWKKYDEAALAEVDALAADYIDFISKCKTERECAQEMMKLAGKAGYRSLDACVENGLALKPGDKVWTHAHGKAIVLVHVGAEPLQDGMNILGAHIDSPRLDLKQNPLYEKDGFALLDTHYYGGIKNYQWVALPLALHGVVAKTDGTVVDVVIGEDEGDPVFCVTDLLPHLGRAQMEKSGNKIVEGEDLDLLVGNRPLCCSARPDGANDANDASDTAAALDGVANDVSAAAADVANAAASRGTQSCRADGGSPTEGGFAPASPSISGATETLAGVTNDQGGGSSPKDQVKEPVRALALKLLEEKYGIAEEDFLSAELEVVPAGRARELGFDRSMVIGYGQDDRVCAYTSLVAQLALAAEGAPVPRRTAVTVLVDKEEIGSVGATGMESALFENAIAEVMELVGEGGTLPLRRALANSRMLSSDVSAGFDPAYASVFEAKNAAFLGRGLVFNKYTGARGKSGSNDASAEYVARVRRVMDDAQVSFQTAELGKVDAGGGGTIAYIPARFGMDVIDSGVPVLSMHAPWEVTSKADIYEARRGYEAFLLNA